MEFTITCGSGDINHILAGLQCRAEKLRAKQTGDPEINQRIAARYDATAQKIREQCKLQCGLKNASKGE